MKKKDAQEIKKAIRQVKGIPEKPGGASSEELDELFKPIEVDGASEKLERLSKLLKISPQSSNIQKDIEIHKLKDYLLRPRHQGKPLEPEPEETSIRSKERSYPKPDEEERSEMDPKAQRKKPASA